MQTLFDKIWNAHVVSRPAAGLAQLYMDRLYCHEVTTPQAFESLRRRAAPFFRPQQAVCMADHDVSTQPGGAVSDERLRHQIALLKAHAAQYGLTYFEPGSPRHGIIHVAATESGLTLPGMTVACGDSHTSTHGALGALALGIGTSEVEMVMASQSLLLMRPRQMRVTVSGRLGRGVTAKDLALHLIASHSTACATGCFVEFAGEVVRALDMDGRQTLCNMAVEMGARGAIIAPDEVTFAYVQQAPDAPKGDAWTDALSVWRTLYSDEYAVFDKELALDAGDVQPMITYGTNPGMAVPVTSAIPYPEDMSPEAAASLGRALAYMQFASGDAMIGKPVDYVFMGSCTNGRFEDFKAFASVVAGRRKAPGVTAWLVPGSQAVARRIEAAGLDRVLAEAGFELRQPGCSACLALNEDKVPSGKYVLSTSNRNFEGRQGTGARTLLCSPYTAAAAAVTGVVSDPLLFLRSDFNPADHA